MPEPRPRVLLADDHPMVLDGLTKLLEPDFEVVATVMDGRELLKAASTPIRPGCGRRSTPAPAAT